MSPAGRRRSRDLPVKLSWQAKAGLIRGREFTGKIG